MKKIFYFFLNSSLTDEPCAEPIITDNFLGDVGDYVEVDGNGYYVRDYAIEDCYQNEYLEY